MAIYVWCQNCKTEYSIKHSVCPKCGTKKPRGKAQYRIKVEYKRRIVKKFFSDITLSVAKEIEAKIRQELIESKYIDRDKKAILFSSFMEKIYLPKESLIKKEMSVSREKQLYNKYIKPVIGNKTLQNILPKDIEKIRANMIKQGLAMRTIQYAIHVVRHVYNVAIQQGLYTGTNPTRNVKIPKFDNWRIRPLKKEEADKLLAELKKRSQTTYEIAFLSLYTGMRFGEIANLTWQDIDFDNDIIHIKDPKNKENRVAYMTKDIKEMFLERQKRGKDKNGLVFPAKNGGKMEKVSQTFPRTVKVLGLNDNITDPRDKVVFHTLRHTFASWLSTNGVQPMVIKELMGHKSLIMTERYSHLAPNLKREAVEQVFGKPKS